MSCKFSVEGFIKKRKNKYIVKQFILKKRKEKKKKRKKASKNCHHCNDKHLDYIYSKTADMV